MAQREGSVYLYLFVVAMMLFVLVTVGFVMKSQELEKVVKGELKKAHGDVADGIAANKTLANELRAVKGLIVGVNLVDNYDDTDDMIENLKTNQLTSVLAAINQANKDLNRKPHPVFTNLLEPYALYPGTFKEYQGYSRCGCQGARQGGQDLYGRYRKSRRNDQDTHPGSAGTEIPGG